MNDYQRGGGRRTTGRCRWRPKCGRGTITKEDEDAQQTAAAGGGPSTVEGGVPERISKDNKGHGPEDANGAYTVD